MAGQIGVIDAVMQEVHIFGNGEEFTLTREEIGTSPLLTRGARRFLTEVFEEHDQPDTSGTCTL